MQYAIQDSEIPLWALDINGMELANVINKLGLPMVPIGHIPFINNLTGLESLDRTQPIFYYGSVQGAELIQEEKFYPGVFGTKSDWNPLYWADKRTDMLNPDIFTITVGELRDNWVTEPKFIKSIGSKLLTGMIIEPFKQDKDYFLIDHSSLPRDTELVISSTVEKLEHEWRFFIVDRKVVAGSTYRRYGVASRKWPVCKEAWDYAIKAAEDWLPQSTVVMDIAETASKGYKVIEFNCVNTSGFYNCNIEHIVMALEGYISSEINQRKVISNV